MKMDKRQIEDDTILINTGFFEVTSRVQTVVTYLLKILKRIYK